MLSLQQMKDLPPAEQEAIIKRVKAARSVAKSTNYAAVYGSGAATLARTAGFSVQEAEKLLAAYWKLNWAVKAVAEEQIVKTCLGMKWLYNPVSGFWHVLRNDRDRFSTLNQSTGVYAFDTWLGHVRKGGPPTIGQMHDEGIWVVKEGLRDKLTKHIQNAMRKTNEQLGLSRELGCDVQFGKRYSEIH